MYVCELTKRKYRGKKPREIRGPDDVVAFIGPKLQKEQREHFLVLLLNARHEVMAKETVSIGSLSASVVHPREVFKPAVLASAASIVLCHNHPSGDPEPSEEDISITKRLFREVIRPWVPADVLTRPKRGFGVHASLALQRTREAQ